MTNPTDLEAAARRIVERLRNDVCLLSKLDWQEHVALAREAADEIERLREVEKAARWQPIKTMPGPCVRAIVGRWVTEFEEPFFIWSEAHWYEFRGQREWSFDRRNWDGEPTVWRPLLEPPALDQHRKETK